MAAAGVCGASGACGADGACGESAVASEHWKVVGKGKGAYERVTSLKYVGEGHGSINKEAHVLVSGRSPVVGAILCMLALPVLIGLGYLFLWGNAPAMDEIPPIATEPDCVTDFANWETSWEEDRQTFCCTHFQRACKAEVKKVPKWVVHDVHVPVDVPVKKEVPVPVTTVKTVQVKAPPPYSCEDKSEVDKWSTDHQRWCCYLKGFGCKPVIVDKTEYRTVTKIKEVQVPHYIEPKKPKVKIVHKDVPYEVPGTPKIIPVKLPQQVIYKTRVQMVPKLIKVEQPSKTVYVKKPVPHHVHPKPIYEKVPVVDKDSYDCNQGFSNWYFGWSDVKKDFCCKTADKGCPHTWHGSLHLHTHVEVSHGVGKDAGHIYDCHAGFSNWKQGWSVSKKKWCCSREQRGCEKFYCDGDSHMWHAEKRDWCCRNFQEGCAKTTLSAMGCDANCVLGGHGSTCQSRIEWTQHHVFAGHGDAACSLAYSKVQVECDVCRACSIEAAGCSIQHVETSEAFDCHAAFNNLHRAWSPAKKQWCCTTKKMGCEGSSPPSVDPGVGMMWKHIQVNGFWVWQAVHGGGAGGIVSLPYDCNAGFRHRATGWSPGKKSWCCKNQKIGCMDVNMAAGAAGAAAAAAASGAAVAAASGATGINPPSIAGHDMMWKHVMSGGQWHWEQHHLGHADMGNFHECDSHWPSGWQQAWNAGQKDYCCKMFGRGCQ